MDIPLARLRLRNRIIGMFPGLASAWERFRFAQVELKRYETEGFGGALPPVLKRAVIRKIALQNALTSFVETGTYLGDTPWRLRDVFDEIHTIELSPVLSAFAKQRFKDFPKIHVYQGDSGELMAEVVRKLRTPTCFWLDSHWSAGFTAKAKMNCPILRELEAIFQNCNVPYAILIDDAADFGGADDYPMMEHLIEFIARHNSSLRVFVENNIVSGLPPVKQAKA